MEGMLHSSDPSLAIRTKLGDALSRRKHFDAILSLVSFSFVQDEKWRPPNSRRLPLQGMRPSVQHAGWEVLVCMLQAVLV